LFLGYINPYVYVAFVIYFPLKKERYLFLFLSFLLGLAIDFFSDSGGINAFSLLFVAYIRLFLIRVLLKKTEQDYLLFNLHEEPFGKVFNYVIILIVIHHFILFSFTNFSLQNFSSILTNTVYSSIFTALLFFIGTYLIRKKK
jgi:rod shape-determining protein MreD